MKKVLSDEPVLFSLIASGDERAFEAIFEHYKSRLVSYLKVFTKSTEDAEELTQEIFLNLWINRKKLATVESPQKYLFVMARNKALDFLRKASVNTRMREKLLQVISEDQDSCGEQDFSNDRIRRVNEAIYKLSRKKQEVFRLSRVEGLTHNQIAVQLSISKNTVKNHIIASVKFIKDYLS